MNILLIDMFHEMNTYSIQVSDKRKDFNQCCVFLFKCMLFFNFECCELLELIENRKNIK